VTSATLDAEKFLKYFFGCPIFSIPARAYLVECVGPTVQKLIALPIHSGYDNEQNKKQEKIESLFTNFISCGSEHAKFVFQAEKLDK
jgi:hypothetical protein